MYSLIFAYNGKYYYILNKNLRIIGQKLMSNALKSNNLNIFRIVEVIEKLLPFPFSGPSHLDQKAKHFKICKMYAKNVFFKIWLQRYVLNKK